MSNSVLKSESLAQLKNRQAIAIVLIGVVEAQVDDPRREAALEKYNQQLANIEVEIALREAHGETVEIESMPGGEQPAGVVVQLKSARLYGQGGNP
jgi:hypothetical protein